MKLSELKAMAERASADAEIKIENGEIVIVEPKPQPQDITDRIKSFDDAIKWCSFNGYGIYVMQYNRIGELFVRDPLNASTDILAYAKLRIITCALNEGWEPNKSDEGYWLAYDVDEDAFYAQWRSAVPTNKALMFRKSEIALYAAEQFRDIYADFCGVKGGEK